ncbi:MAG: hypothetical protein PHG96_11505 [Kiritimatiellae bacterium]|nr:hypothetical protein [Kiritimatiellia bacterium]
MSTLLSTRHTLLDLANQIHNGNILKVAEVLNETNEIFLDAVWVEANMEGGHKGNVRTSLPAGTWRKVNDGVAKEKSTTRMIIETIGELQSRSEVDKLLYDLAPNKAAYRTNEDMAFLEGLGQTFADTFIYGDVVANPEQFNGLDLRIQSKTASNAVDGGGSGSDTTSIWVVQWGVNKVHFVYPRGSQIGIEMRDLGEQSVDGETSTTKFQALVTLFTLRAGLFVHDDRCIQRICNIESAGSSNTFDENDLITALNRLPYGGVGATIYCNQTIKTQMDIRAKDKTNVNYTPGEAFGRPVTFFRGVPVRKVDAILDTETALS